MCRITLYASAKEHKNIRRLIKCFKLGSVNDFVLDAYKRGRRVHGHGWGFAYVYGISNDMGHMYYRTSLPIAMDDTVAAIALPRYADWILMILHSRLTSEEPIDIVNSHPYHFSRVGNFTIWLAHNGSIDKERIAKELGLADIVRRYSDSYFLTHFIGKNTERVSSTDIVDAVRKAVDLGIVRSSLNLVAIILDETEKKVLGVAVNLVTEDYMDMFDYYRLYKIGIGNRSVAIASSTIALYINKLYDIDIEPLSNNTIVFAYPRREGVDLEIRKV